MSQTMRAQINALGRMTTSELADEYEQLHNRPCRTRHRAYLIRKVAWRIQANAEGDLSERARKRAAELADDAEIRVMAPKTMICPPESGPETTVSRSVPHRRDSRLPSPGSVIVREYKGRTIRVLVNEDGFELEGDGFGTLSAVAKKITGSHINGFRFFRLGTAR